MNVATCSNNKEVMLEGGSNMVLAKVTIFFIVTSVNNGDGVFYNGKRWGSKIIECCGFGSLESFYYSCFERGNSYFERLKS
jgi:hypothetical protein